MSVPDPRNPEEISQYVADLDRRAEGGEISAGEKGALLAELWAAVLGVVAELMRHEPSPELADLISRLLNAAGLPNGRFADFLARCGEPPFEPPASGGYRPK